VCSNLISLPRKLCMLVMGQQDEGKFRTWILKICRLFCVAEMCVSVFLLVARGGHVGDDKPILASSTKLLTSEDTGRDELANTKSERSSVRSQMDLTKESLFLRHVSALTRKRAANFSRDKKAWFCTTLVPTIMVFLGLLLVKIIPSDKNLQPITLNLQNLNSDVTAEPINPIAYNSPSSPYLCSPGLCAYSPQLVSISETNEFYGFCGFEANPSYADGLNENSCSISASNPIMQFVGSEATAEQISVSDILNVSKL
jgi:hypothetical protein